MSTKALMQDAGMGETWLNSKPVKHIHVETNIGDLEVWNT